MPVGVACVGVVSLYLGQVDNVDGTKGALLHTDATSNAELYNCGRSHTYVPWEVSWSG